MSAIEMATAALKLALKEAEGRNVDYTGNALSVFYAAMMLVNHSQSWASPAPAEKAKSEKSDLPW